MYSLQSGLLSLLDSFGKMAFFRMIYVHYQLYVFPFASLINEALIPVMLNLSKFGFSQETFTHAIVCSLTQ